MPRWDGEQVQERDDGVGALGNPCERSVRRPAADQSRTAVRAALGRVVPRRSSSLGHRPPAAGDRACGCSRRIRRAGTRRGLRNRRERSAHRLAGAAGPGRRRGGDRPGDRSGEGPRARNRRRVRRGRRVPARPPGTQVPVGAGLRAVPRPRRRRATRIRGQSRVGDRARWNPVRAVLPDPGPHPVRADELRAAFDPRTGFSVAAIEADLVHTRFHEGGAPAWLATITRL
jgi:hypothetical protein